MTTRNFFAAALLTLFAIPSSSADELKYHDKDLIYDESRIPAFDLPPWLASSEGTPISTPVEWLQIRRPQIMSLFGNLIYGTVPRPELPLQVAFEQMKLEHQFMDGLATRKEVRIRFENARGKAEMFMQVFVPKAATKRVPAFLILSFDNTRGPGYGADPSRSGYLRNGWPIGEFIKRGFGLVVVYQQDLVGHNEVEFLGTIQRLFYREGQSFPKAYEWGVISTIAWSASRALDYLETDHDIDASRIAVLGHSKCGKAALWAGAQDQRFALVISAQSGHPGAALSRRKFGETLEKTVTRFPYWLCRNVWKFVNNEDDIPVDQHMLLACIAPRPLYVMSGADDTWADPRGEYLSACHASPVYRLFGKKGLETEASPPLGEAIIQSDVGYHIRPGGHSIELYDWLRFLDFAEVHLLN